MVVVAWSQILGGGGGEEVIDEVKGVSHASHEVEAAEERAGTRASVASLHVLLRREGGRRVGLVVASLP